MSTTAEGPRICFILPAYNEGFIIRSIVTKLDDALKKEGSDYQIVVVDDASKDDTATKAAVRQVKVIKHIINVGSGGATATGLSYAQQNGFNIAATMDADGQHNPDDAIKGIKLMLHGEADLLIGSRLIDSSGMSNVKVIGNRGLSIITYIIFGVNITDSQSGMRIFSKNALEKLKWKTSGYEFCSEMLWRAKQQKLKIKEYPIRAVYTEYSLAKGQNNWNAINIIKSLVQRRLMELFGE
ncbi:MAG TPA: glycosyltransferase family 2 protein [Candidatus Saccharimonadales bacterium]|nr:glycosyltransferase family 2 protein [Candidatus Saccharimonadales bacterium]